MWVVANQGVRTTGRSVLTLRFPNALYAQGVRDFALDLRILKHTTNYLVTEPYSDDPSARARTVIISHIEFEWIKQFCPELWKAKPPASFGSVEQGSVSFYLKALFGIPG